MTSLKKIQTLLSLICLLISTTIVFPMDRKISDPSFSSSSSSRGSSSSSSHVPAPSVVESSDEQTITSASEISPGAASVPGDRYYRWPSHTPAVASSTTTRTLSPRSQALIRNSPHYSDASYSHILCPTWQELEMAVHNVSPERFAQLMNTLRDDDLSNFIKCHGTRIARIALSNWSRRTYPVAERSTARIEILLDHGTDPNTFLDEPTHLITMVPHQYSEILDILDLLVSRGASLIHTAGINYLHNAKEKLKKFEKALRKKTNTDPVIQESIRYKIQVLQILVSRMHQLQEYQIEQQQRAAASISATTPLIPDLAALVGTYHIPPLPERRADQHVDPNNEFGLRIQNHRAAAGSEITAARLTTATSSPSTQLVDGARAAITRLATQMSTAVLGYVVRAMFFPHPH